MKIVVNINTINSHRVIRSVTVFINFLISSLSYDEKHDEKTIYYNLMYSQCPVIYDEENYNIDKLFLNTDKYIYENEKFFKQQNDFQYNC